jgi:probable rRNA maturation factor
VPGKKASQKPGFCVKIDVLNRTRTVLPSMRLLKRAAELTLKPLAEVGKGLPLSASLVCVGGRRMRAMNSRFTGRSCLTDVLAFEDMEVDRAEGVFRVGDVIICSQVAAREAQRRCRRTSEELLLYAIHGWLHLAGYRDKTEDQRAEMVQAEIRILAELGLTREA